MSDIYTVRDSATHRLLVDRYGDQITAATYRLGIDGNTRYLLTLLWETVDGCVRVFKKAGTEEAVRLLEPHFPYERHLSLRWLDHMGPVTDQVREACVEAVMDALGRVCERGLEPGESWQVAIAEALDPWRDFHSHVRPSRWTLSGEVCNAARSVYAEDLMRLRDTQPERFAAAVAQTVQLVAESSLTGQRDLMKAA